MHRCGDEREVIDPKSSAAESACSNNTAANRDWNRPFGMVAKVDVWKLWHWR